MARLEEAHKQVLKIQQDIEKGVSYEILNRKLTKLELLVKNY